MADEKKKSVAEFASDLRDQFDVPPGTSDEQLVSGYLAANPQELSKINTSEARKAMGGPIGRYLKGLGAPFAEMAKSLSTPKGAAKGAATALFPQVMMPIQGMQKSYQDFKDIKAGKTDEVISRGGSEVDLPNITRDIEKGDWAHASGRATTAAFQLALLFSPFGGETSAAGAMAKFNAMTDTVSAPLKATLDEQFAGVTKSMQGQMVDVQSLRQTLTPLAKKLEKLDSAPGTKAGDFTALKNSVDKLMDRSKQGMLPWNDLRDNMKEIGAAAAKIDDPSMASSLTKEIVDGAKDILQKGADKAGKGAEYEKLIKNYAQFSDLKKRYAQVLKQKTDPQVISKQTAKSSPSLRVLGTTPIRFGRSRLGKIVKTNEDLINAAHDAFDELHKQIKTPAKPRPAPPQAPPKGAAGGGPPPGGGAPPSPPTTPPPGGGGGPAVPPVSGGSGPTSGTYVRPQPRTGFGTGQGVENEPKWPANYQGGAQTLDSSGSGGANYSAEDLAKLKERLGIK